MSNWRLTSDVVAYIVSSGSGNRPDHIYLAAPEKKSYQTDVLKNIPSGVSYSDTRLDINEFNLKIDKNLDIYIKSENLPNPEAWYVVKNYVNRLEVGKYFTQLKSDLGDFGDVLFEASFNEDEHGKIDFVAPGMIEYKECFEELKRRTNCELFKKTKKWVPGHRYDSLKETRYYLGSVMSRFGTNMNKSEFSDVPTLVHLYVNEYPGDLKSVSEVLKASKFGELPQDVKVMDNFPLMVDAGEVLVDDMGDDFSVYWNSMIQNSIDSTISVGWTGYKKYPRVKENLLPLAFQSSGNLDYTRSVTDEVKFKVKDIFKTSLLDIIVRHWNLSKGREDMTIKSDKTLKTNIDNLKRLYFHLFIDGNIMKNIYYPNFYKAVIGEDFDVLVEDVIQGWDESIVTSSFESYLKYSDYVITHYTSQSKISSKQRIKSTNYKLEVVTIQDLLGNTVLGDSLKEIVTDIRDNFGLGAADYYISNVGNRREPKLYENIRITVKEIISWYAKKGLEMPENLKREIVGNKFWELTVSIDKDGTLK